MRSPLLVCVAGILCAASAFAQIECQVSVNMEQLPGNLVTDQLQSFKYDIENYINGNRWSTDDLGGEKIKCSITIFFTAGSDNSYNAQFFLGSQRPVYVGKNPSRKSTAMLRLFDDQWTFTYIKNQPLVRNETQFDDLTDFLDFYMNIVIGFDYDSYDPLSGTPFFQKALTFCNQAPGTAKGWVLSASGYSKKGFVEELLSAQYATFREGLYRYHVKGIDLLATRPDDGFRNIVAFIQQTADTKKSINQRSLLMKSFFDTKYLELAEIFKNYQDKSIYQLLSAVDPGHQTSYDEAKKN